MSDYSEFIAVLQSRLNNKRFIHSLAVADEAKRLANMYCADAEKAYLAGLLHDITKNTDREEQLKLFERFGIIPTDIERNAEKLWHAMTGSAFVKYELGVCDDEIISAIRYHTTARSSMTLLEKILYLADYTSSDRDYDGVDEMRRLVDIGLAPAMEFALSYTVEDLAKNRMPIHPDTLDAYNEVFLEKRKEEK